jgi:hypothetical protein
MRFEMSRSGRHYHTGDDRAKAAYLGYSVIRPVKPNCIGRTLLTHARRTEAVHLLGRQLEVEGFPFISQDSDATVCAESALWKLLRYYSNRYHLY